jgi:hypothetical protein
MNGEDTLPRPKAEKEDADTRIVATIASSLAIVVAIGLLGGLFTLGRTRPRAGTDELFQHGVVAATDVQLSWDAIDHAPSASPAGYAWIDRQAGVVQVPIDRAIDLVCAEQNSRTSRREGEPAP